MVLADTNGAWSLSLSLFEPVVAVDATDGQWFAVVSDGISQLEVLSWPLEDHCIDADASTVITIQLYLAEDELQFLRGECQCFAEVHVPAAQILDVQGSVFRGWLGLQRGRRHGEVDAAHAARLFEVGSMLAQNLLTPKVCCSVVDGTHLGASARLATGGSNCSSKTPCAVEGPLLRSVAQHSDIISQMHQQLRLLWKQKKLICREDYVVELLDNEVEGMDDHAFVATRNSQETEQRRRHLAGLFTGDLEPEDEEEKMARLQDECDRLMDEMQQIHARLEESERECQSYREKYDEALSTNIDERKALNSERQRADTLAQQLETERSQVALLQRQLEALGAQQPQEASVGFEAELAKRDAEIAALREELQACNGATRGGQKMPPFSSTTSSTSSPSSRRLVPPQQPPWLQQLPRGGNNASSRGSRRQRSTSPPMPTTSAVAEPAAGVGAAKDTGGGAGKSNGIAWGSDVDGKAEAGDVAELRAMLELRNAEWQERETAFEEEKARVQAELQAAQVAAQEREERLRNEVHDLEAASAQMQQQHSRQLDELLKKQERTAAEIRALRMEQDTNGSAVVEAAISVPAPTRGVWSTAQPRPRSLVRGASWERLPHPPNYVAFARPEAVSTGRSSIEVPALAASAAARAWSAERHVAVQRVRPGSPVRVLSPASGVAVAPVTERQFVPQRRALSPAPTTTSGAFSPSPSHRRGLSPTPTSPAPAMPSNASFTAAAPASGTTPGAAVHGAGGAKVRRMASTGGGIGPAVWGGNPVASPNLALPAGHGRQLLRQGGLRPVLR